MKRLTLKCPACEQKNSYMVVGEIEGQNLTVFFEECKHRVRITQEDWKELIHGHVS